MMNSQDKKENNVIQLVKPSSDDGLVDTNWISRLEVGDRFLFAVRVGAPNEFGVNQGEVLYKFKTSTMFRDPVLGGPSHIVQNVPFSSFMKCIEVLPPFPVAQETTDEQPAAAE